MNAPLDPDSDSQLPRWFGDYLLLKRLGKGGMGQVFLARLPGVAGIDRLCVIKTLRSQWTNDREYVARFVDEARVVVQLNHRNICPVFDVGQVRNTYYLAMDLVPGRDVQAVLERCASLQVALPLDLTLLVIGEILEALDAAHRLRDPETDAPVNLVHRDVSPHNALISFDGEVKLIDFGLAQSALKQERTEPGVVLGKLAYMAPEHARGDVVDRRADLFAVGVMLYELAVNERYWSGFSLQQIWQEVGVGRHRPAGLSSLPNEVRALIEKATASSPADRYRTGAEMKAAVSAVQIARGIIASSADLRTQMDALFDGEATADRRERAALMKMPAPGVQMARESTRIAFAPGAPAAPTSTVARPAGVSPLPTERASDPLGEVDDVPTLSERERAQLSTDSDEAPTQIVARPGAETTTLPASPPSAQRPSSRRAVVVAAAVVVIVVVVVFFGVGIGGPAAPGGVPVAAVPSPADPAAVPPVVPAALPPAPPAVPAPPLEIGAAPEAAIEAVPVVEPLRAPPSTKPPKTPKAPAVEPWPSPWPRFPEERQQLLGNRCAATRCAKRLTAINVETLDKDEVTQLQVQLLDCLIACKGNK